MKTNLIGVVAVIAVTIAASIWALNWMPAGSAGGEHEHASSSSGHDDHADEGDHGHGEHDDHEEDEKGPHGGRMLSHNDFAVEIVIAESGLPPEFRVYGYDHGNALAPDDFSVQIKLRRLGGTIDAFEFAPAGDYLRGNGVVREPHSFDVEIDAAFEGASFHWEYESHEGRTSIPDEVARESGIGLATAGPAVIVDTIELTGTVQAVPSGISEVRARFPGLVKKIRKDIGDDVRVGDVLAVIESNESLRDYDVRAPISGLVVARNLQVGQVAADQPLYQIIDLSTVWVQLDALGRNASRVGVGQDVRIITIDGHEVSGAIEWLSPLVAHGSQSQRARVPLPNADRRIRPGQFVRGIVTARSSEVPLAVRASALQTFRDFDVVYEKVGMTYEVRMLTLGQRDSEHVEVLDGLSPDAVYVAENSYLIKADIDKSGASHDH